MLRSKLINLLLLLVFLCVGQSAFSQLSKTHYIPPLTESGTNSSQPQDHYIYISTPSTNLVSFSIQLIGSGASITGSVSKTSPYICNIGTGRDTQLFVNINETSRVKTNKGFIVEAESPVYVSVRVNAGAQAGALVSKGASALGNTFRVGSFTNSNPQSNYLNFVSVMATSDNTLVAFSDLPSGLIIENYSGLTPFNITLNKGESYVVATNSLTTNVNRDGLIGCLVQSDKPIVVNCGSANGSFYGGSGRDYGIDQIVDVSKVGKEYIFVRGAGDDGWENVLIVAHSNNTFISINGNSPIGPISEGEYYLIEGSSYNTNGNMYVETTENVFAYQGIGGLAGAEANQGMFFVPPLSCETRGNLDNIAAINNIGSTVYTGGITIVTKVSATITINNSPISSFNSVGPSTVTGKPDYVTYKVLNLSGNISVQSNDELYCAYFNQNNNATSGSFYSGFPTAPEINFNAQFTTLGNCIPNITLEAANTKSFDSFEWWFDDGSGSGFQKTPISTPSITPSIPGKYKLIGIVACSGLTLESIEVPVSICPDDVDNDGIIDNIDIDNDNDGILNCTESRGDVILDLSDTRPPRLKFEDGTTNATIATDNITLNSASGNTNSIRLTSTGTFTSTIAPDTNGENIYNIAFNEPVNLKFYENTSVIHTSVSGEFFIAKILPVNKNITLIDPDNRLLVDSNFDGVFETGITQISGSEIHFKINPTPTGNIPYAFYANKVDDFSFVHKLNNLSQTSIFSATIGLNCFKQDSDLDGIEDALDLDSDNDGIPDFIENTGTLVTLSGIDSDKNGLDDVYNINATPLDSDNDGVYDYHDLDSDNDGIYDLVETGQFGILFDTDLNGVIDSGFSFGTNGWIDDAETAPDSNLIGYTLNNLDADTLFSYIDLDSDGDACNDVIEAGFSDANNDAILGDSSITIDVKGKVSNATDGYTIPNSNYLNYAPITITTQPTDTDVCETSNTTIFVVSPEADTYQWETSTDGINWNTINDDATYNGTQTANLIIKNTPLTFNNYSYRVKLDRNGNSCGIYSNAMKLSVNPTPVINTPVVLVQCDDDIDGVSFFNLTEANNKISNNASNETFTYFKTQATARLGDVTSTNYIPTSTAYQNTNAFTDTVWARVTTQLGCASVSEIQLQVSISQIPSGAINEVISMCDDFLDINGDNNTNNDDTDGIATFDFSYVKPMVESYFLPQTPSVTFYRNEADALAENNAITDTSNYRNIGYPHSQQIYIRVDSEISNDCRALGPYITLNVNPLPEFTVETPQIVCTSDPSFSIILDPFEANVTENFNYSWIFEGNEIATGSSLEVSTPGMYTVTLTKADGSSCYRSKAISVEASETANITQNDVTINDLAENNSVIINPDNLGSGNYEYALREMGSSFINYQEEPIFNNVKPGFYTIYVQDEICGESTLDISVIGYTKYFTPNGDGFNDFWQIKGINTNIQPNSIIFIYDRYGKLLKQLSPNSIGWDGTFNGNLLPTDDYWFKVFLQDGRNFMGHFTLKR